MSDAFRFGAVEQEHIDKNELFGLPDQPEYLVEDFVVFLFATVRVVTGDIGQQDRIFQRQNFTPITDTLRQGFVGVVEPDSSQHEQ